jgi:hypothetical protein
MPRDLPLLAQHLEITNAQRQSKKLHAMPALIPQLPAGINDRKRLQKNLEIMGLGSHFLSFPWSLTSSRLVDELTTLWEIPIELQGNAYQGELAPVTQELVADIYGMRNEGEERPRAIESRLHKKYFNVTKDSSDGYPLSSWNTKELWDIFGFICPILDPTRPAKVHIYRFNQVYLLLHLGTKVNWARLMYRTVHKCSKAWEWSISLPTCPHSCTTTTTTVMP